MLIKYDSRKKLCIQLQLISLKWSYLTSVDNVQHFAVVVQKFVCIIFCRVISSQHGGSGDLRNKDFVIAILHCHKFMHYRCLRK